MTLSGTHLIRGSEGAISSVLDHLRLNGIAVEANPDLYVRSYTHFGIDEARELRDRAVLASSTGQRTFVVHAPMLTSEAQNALLKTLEEPPVGTVFFLIVSSPETLLPTLRSRSQMLRLHNEEDVSVVDARAFLKASPAMRLEMIKPLLDKDDDDRRDVSAIVTFLSSLEVMLQEGEHLKGLDPVYRAKKYLGDKGALIKPLLEQVALLTPVVS